MERAYLSLGSNLGDRLAFLVRGIRHLTRDGDIVLEQVASVYATAPWGRTDVPPYLNTAVAVRTALSPRQLLARCQAAEQACGRVRLERWGSRTLDVDILLYGRQVVDEPDLKIPHPYMAERAFVLVPLAELDPDLRLPAGGRVADLLPGVAGQAVAMHVPAAELRRLVESPLLDNRDPDR